jgi:hypothetical protein
MWKTTGMRATGAFVTGLALATLGLPTPALGQALTVTGYGDFEASVAGLGSDSKELVLDNHHVNFILIGEITGDLFFASEIEYEHAGAETAMEYGYLGYGGFTDFRIMAGKFLLPFGRFNKDLHPTTVNKLPSMPLGFRHVVPTGWNDEGVWIQGARAVNDDSRFVYDAYVVNGLLGDDGGDIRDLRDNIGDEAEILPNDEYDNDKAVGARLGFELPFSGFEIGGSFFTGRYSVSEAGDNLRITMLGVDAAYEKNGFAARGELARADQGATPDDLTKTGFYVQASYRLNDVVEPVVRYSGMRMPGDAQDLDRVALGLNFQVSSASIVRVAYLRNMEKSAFTEGNDAIITQFNVIF